MSGASGIATLTRSGRASNPPSPLGRGAERRAVPRRPLSGRWVLSRRGQVPPGPQDGFCQKTAFYTKAETCYNMNLAQRQGIAHQEPGNRRAAEKEEDT